MRTSTALIFCCLTVIGLAGESAESGKAELKDKLQQAEKRAQKLAANLEQANADLNEAKDTTAPFSLTGAIVSTGRVATDVFQHALDGTEFDDKVFNVVSSTYGTARAFAVDSMGKIAEVDYNTHLNKLQSHDLYVKHVAPAVETIRKQAEPHIEKARVREHVNLATTKVREVAGPAWNAFAEKAGDVVPALQMLKERISTKANAVPEYLSVVETKIGNFIVPLFDFAAKASPVHAKSLPRATWDRVLFLVLGLLTFYYVFLFFVKFLLVTMLRVAYKLTSAVLKVFVILPLKITLRLVDLTFWFSTCFYCCGLCRRKSKPVEEKKGKPTAGKSTKKEKASVEEVQQLLEASKKKGKIDDAVKLLCTKEKECKPLEGKSFPENVRGKFVDKETLKKAFGKFKEIDMKQL